MKNQEKGFTFVELLLVLLIFCLIGGIGWIVLRPKGTTPNTKDQTKQSGTQSNEPSTPAVANDVCGEPISYKKTDFSYSGWKDIDAKAFTVKYPGEGWKLNEPYVDSKGITSNITLETNDYEGQEYNTHTVDSGAYIRIVYRDADTPATDPTRETIREYNSDDDKIGIAHTAKINDQVACQFAIDEDSWKNIVQTFFFPDDGHYLQVDLYTPQSTGPTEKQLQTYKQLNASIQFK